MGLFGKAVLIMVVVALLAPTLACGIEYRPGEKAAEDLFNKGIGKPWVGGEPFKSTYSSQPKQPYIVKPYTSYQIIGYLDVGNSFSVVSDSGKSLQLMPGPGSYPVYGYYKSGRLMGLFFDFSSSGRTVQMYPYL